MPNNNYAHVESMTPAEVATLFEVDPKTVTRWADIGRLKFFRTLGGHRRFRTADVMKVYNRENGVKE